MITEVYIRNFLCYEEATIPFDKMTVITGANLSGKTTIQRAIWWCLYNEGTWSDEPARDTIRREIAGELADDVEVTVTFDNGLSVTRYRDSTNNQYVISPPDSEDINIDRPGRGFVDAVGEATGLKPVQWPDGNETPVQMQADMQQGRFLLMDSDSAVDDKLGVLMSVEAVEEATRTAQRNARSLSQDINNYKEQVDEIDDALEQYVLLPYAREQYDRAVELQNEYDGLAETLDDAKTTAPIFNRSRNVVEILTDIGDLAESTGPLNRRLTNLRVAQTEATSYRRTNETIRALSDIEVANRRIDPTREAIESASAAIDGLSMLQGTQWSEDTDWAAMKDRYNNAKGIIETLTEVSEATDKYETATIDIDEVDQKIAAAEDEKATILEQIDVCPIDGKPHDKCPFTGDDNRKIVN